MKKKPVAMVVLGLLLIAGGTWFWQSNSAGSSGPLVLYGNVDICEVDLAFRQPGRIARLRFDEGASVKQGELLAELDARPYEDALAAAKASRAMAMADLDKLRRGSRVQEIAQAAAAVRQAEAAAQEAEQDFARHTTLAASGAVSQRALETARSLHTQTRAALASAQQGLLLRKEGFRQEEIAAAEARLAGAEAQLAQARTALADTRLAAPSDGLISTRIREVVSMVTNTSPVYTLSLQEPVYVRAYVSGPQLTRVRPGSVVGVKADGSAEVFKGTVGFISPRAEFTPKSVETTDLRTDLVYRLRIVLPGAARALRQGMPVTVQITED